MTRNDILDAAAQVFRKKGFHGASMSDIAEAVNLQKASLYHHVASKQEILLALLDRALDILIEDIERVVGQPLPPDEKLRLAMAAYLQDMLEHHDLAVILLLEHRSLEPQYHTRHMLRRDRFEHLWRDIIQLGKDKGIFNCADTALASRYILGVMNWVIIWYRPDGSLTPVEIADQYADLFLEGILIRKG